MRAPAAERQAPAAGIFADPARARFRLLAVAAVLAALLVGGGAGAVLAITRKPATPAPAVGRYANLMGLSTMGGAQAPGFALVDQNGKAMSLASLRGHPVVLEFMDPHCIDVCPIVSQEFVDAAHDLGPAMAKKVEFVAVNVNPYANSVAAVARFTNEFKLNTLPHWHFFTGPVPALQAVWKAYGIYVKAPSPTADVIHSSYIFFIGPHGHERYLASPTVDTRANGTGFLPIPVIKQWGQGIAAYVKRL